ncbi:unnamed protein product [Parascedosporium putredinis]|uniref:Uncharacterized protein n=1 Tax=Parascedosporium putredinis TaxID=1442378 RepID=A0A9P1GWA4_9PEZI|nr:unnamed protein product [Parascedosporium putredinis]CAI7989348.1 unnamed protein product [Parascedosporium putredinis]
MGEIQALEREIDNLLPNRWDRPKNTKLDEIRAREKEIMSNKSVGQESTAFYDAASANRPSYGLGQGEQIPHTPVTIYRKGRQDNISNTKAPSVEDSSNKASTNSNRDSDVPRDRQINDLATQDSSRELLQRLHLHSIPALSSDEDEPKDDGAADETPRPKRQQDILAMPTPRIIGAYVGTPATIKVGRVEDDKPTRPPLRLNPREPSRSTGDEETARAILEDLKDKLLEEVTKDQEKKRPGRSSKERTPDGGSDLEALNRMTKSVTSSLRDLHAVKRGIDRLSDQVNLPDLNPADQGAEPTAKPVAPAGSDAIDEKTLAKATELLKAELLKSGPFPPAVSNPDQAAVVHYPQLYTNRPFRLTLLGLVTGLFTLWCVAESAMCAQYCRPAICSEPPCVWSPDDPTRLADEWDDLVADASDLLHGVDIRTTNPDELDFRDRRQYRRRMRKKGLLKQRAESPAHKEKWDAWHAARIATERASAAREMGYDVYDESESMGDDAKG